MTLPRAIDAAAAQFPNTFARKRKTQQPCAAARCYDFYVEFLLEEQYERWFSVIEHSADTIKATLPWLTRPLLCVCHNQ